MKINTLGKNCHSEHKCTHKAFQQKQKLCLIQTKNWTRPSWFLSYLKIIKKKTKNNKNKN